jgi:hypothetical protein
MPCLLGLFTADLKCFFKKLRIKGRGCTNVSPLLLSSHIHGLKYQQAFVRMMVKKVKLLAEIQNPIAMP